MFGEGSNEVVSASLPFFVPTELFWGLGLIVFSILFSFFLWHQKFGFNLRGIVFWLINLAIFIFALMRLSAAFPRLPFGITFGALLVLILVLAGGTVVAKKKEGSKEDEDSGTDKGSK